MPNEAGIFEPEYTTATFRAIDDYVIDWASESAKPENRLADDEIISSVAYDYDPLEITEVSRSNTATTTTIRLQAAKSDASYLANMIVEITANTGRRFEKGLLIRFKSAIDYHGIG